MHTQVQQHSEKCAATLPVKVKVNLLQTPETNYEPNSVTVKCLKPLTCWKEMPFAFVASMELDTVQWNISINQTAPLNRCFGKSLYLSPPFRGHFSLSWGFPLNGCSTEFFWDYSGRGLLGIDGIRVLWEAIPFFGMNRISFRSFYSW